ncbi:MAG: plasmid stabilization system protein ParE [Akkermansiaceae bacterium]|jgi:plasmid stabilization system protein ParE
MILRLSKSAKRDLKEISKSTKEKWGTLKEGQYLNALFDRFEQIEEDKSR